MAILISGIVQLAALWLACCLAKWLIGRHYMRPFTLRLTPSDWEHLGFSPWCEWWRITILVVAGAALVDIAWGLACCMTF